MPIYDGAESLIRANLSLIEAKKRAPMIAIGDFTVAQFDEINRLRESLALHPLEQNEIVFIGAHVYSSRSRDGYTLDDMTLQICTALRPCSLVMLTKAMSGMRSSTLRSDGYGNMVLDHVVFEMTRRKPRAELFSVIPKGDVRKPPRK